MTTFIFGPVLPPITKTIRVRRTRHAGHCWRSRDEFISDVLLWTPTYGRAKAGRPANTYIQQLCEDTGCSPEDLPEVMNNREKWQERARDIRASCTTWWWWWFIFGTRALQYEFFLQLSQVLVDVAWMVEEKIVDWGLFFCIVTSVLILLHTMLTKFWFFKPQTSTWTQCCGYCHRKWIWVQILDETFCLC